MQATTETTALEREIAIAASPETVWEFLVDEDKAILWMGERATFDLRPGGSWSIDVLPANTASGEFVEIDPPHRLVYSFGWASTRTDANQVPLGSSTIEIELVPDGDGTMLRFTHRDLPGAKVVESHTQGWDHYLGRLAVVAAGGDAGRDPWLDSPSRPAPDDR
jgi:uncharacterized protein YndB with AHSA1/START domain